MTTHWSCVVALMYDEGSTFPGVEFEASPPYYCMDHVKHPQCCGLEGGQGIEIIRIGQGVDC